MEATTALPDIDLKAAIASGQAHVCSTKDVDETVTGLLGEMTQREAIMGIWTQVQFAQWMVLNTKRWDGKDLHRGNRMISLDTVRAFLMYAAEHPSRRKRKPMDIDAMVERWLVVIKGLATAHDKATVDKCEFDSEEYLVPLTAAPVAQLRQFYRQLCTRLEGDPSIPFFVWRSFRTWGDVILDKLPDGGVKKLRGDLAKKVADLVEADIRPDLNAALVGALQWRSADDLQAIETAVAAGAKPRMKGRESCLFLEVDRPSDGKTITVML